MSALKDHYIRALEYAESRRKFTLDDLAKAIELTDKQKEQLAYQISRNLIFNQDASDYSSQCKTQAIDLHFSVEDKFKLLNYVALEEARKSSKTATWFASSALLVSIFSILVSAILSDKQLDSPVNIPEEFVKKIDGLSKGQDETKKAISDLSRSVSTQREPKEKNPSIAK